MHKDDNYERTVFSRLRAKLRVNHDAKEITARLQDEEGLSVLRATIGKGYGPALGASLRLDEDSDCDTILAGLYVGRARLYVGARTYGLRDALRRLGIGRRVLSAEVYRWDDTDVANGATLFQAHLWSRDEGRHSPQNVWVNLTDKLWGRCESKDAVLEERDVVLTLPEAAYPCRAKLIERTITRPRWPLQRFVRYIEFLDVAAIVPQRKSDSFAHVNMDGRVTVEGSTIEQGIGALTGRIMQDRAHYGGKRWAHGIPSREHWQDSHKVTLTSLDRMGGALAKGYTGPSFSIERDLMQGEEPLVVPGAAFARDNDLGGLMVVPLGEHHIMVQRGQRSMCNFTKDPVRLFPGDMLTIGEVKLYVHFAPIGPPRAGSAYDRNPTGETIAEAFGYVAEDVAAAVQDLAAHPEVSPTDEAEGAAAREYMAFMPGVQMDIDTADRPTEAISQLRDIAEWLRDQTHRDLAGDADDLADYIAERYPDAGGELVCVGKIEKGPMSKALGVAHTGEEFAELMTGQPQGEVETVFDGERWVADPE